MPDAYITMIGIGVQTLLYLAGGYAMIVRNDTKQQMHSEALKTEVGDMKKELKELAKVITIQAVQTNRLDNLTSQVALIDRRVEDLRRGNGYVKGRTGLDGEYD